LVKLSVLSVSCSLGGDGAPAREHVGGDAGAERISKLQIAVVDEAIELDPCDRADGGGALVARLRPQPGEVAAHCEVAVELVGEAAARVVARLEVDVLGVVEMRERAVAAPRDTQPETPVHDLLVLCLGPTGARRHREEECAHGNDTLT
jgi:hypothetical protein